ncbi:MAG: 5-oxoprolinase [Chloroflexi bacterium GWB2_49_20]|nr:MAG: 5-oxoprolinase [Chloroflexi bacterium GWB2_49_20]OGN79680.1 MAG: 5-oxoprolinase [Chloroflexi bacterium GWC2_49_37]OGN85928.1 MAG: 5-oxoprolinase [Chloroflexi bacterium GWD2_49_16]HBG74014.1 5-oxoprolinase [Anaerolineae bacterium]HCC78719.1 5-oxoprolinase [Anaerolineae bacterium]
MLRVATDIGGTFTDLVYITAGGKVGTAKSHTTTGQFEKGVMDVIKASHITPKEFISFIHGTTIVINTIIEMKGAKVALLTTEGFRDILEIGRGNRPDFFNLEYPKPKPFVPRYLRREVPERISFKGIESKPLDLSDLPAILDDFCAEGVEAIAISFINSYANSAHEEAALSKVKELWPEVSVVASYQITREWREYERTNTAVLSAYVQPIAHRYLDRLNNCLSEAGMRCTPYIMQSNCGVDTLKSARQIPITMIESGPASGVWGAAALGRLIGELNAIALDIGGTTAKCGLITNGEVKLNSNYMVAHNETSAGYPVMVSVVDLVEIGNGGGSIAWVDEFQRLHVGPQSAGAVPGPVSYGAGGMETTTTDANLVLGRINPNYFCGGTQIADMAAVYKELDKLAAILSSSQREVARGIIRIANNSMVNAIKLISVNRGHDPRDFTLIAFGGGGGMHACALAKELGIKKVVIPSLSAVFSAWGMLLSDLRRDYLQTQIVELSGAEAAAQINQALILLEEHAIQEFASENIERSQILFLRYGRCRYQNQEHFVEIALPDGAITSGQINAIIERFHTKYEREYTYRLEASAELVCYHLVALIEVDKLKPEKHPRTGRKLIAAINGKREVDYVEAGIHQATIYNGDVLEPGMSFIGPAIIEESGTTVVIPPGLPCQVDDFGNYCIQTA